RQPRMLTTAANPTLTNRNPKTPGLFKSGRIPSVTMQVSDAKTNPATVAIHRLRTTLCVSTGSRLVLSRSISCSVFICLFLRDHRTQLLEATLHIHLGGGFGDAATRRRFDHAEPLDFYILDRQPDFIR